MRRRRCFKVMCAAESLEELFWLRGTCLVRAGQTWFSECVTEGCGCLFSRPAFEPLTKMAWTCYSPPAHAPWSACSSRYVAGAGGHRPEDTLIACVAALACFHVPACLPA